MSEPRPEPVYRELTTIRWASLGEALAMQASLGAAGFEAFIPDQMMKAIDPFLTGPNAFTVKLQVPATQADDARTFLESWESERGAPPADTPPEASERPRRYAVVEKLGSRIRIGFLFTWMLLLPVLPFIVVRYMRVARRLRPRPQYHNWTLFAAAFSAVLYVAALVGVVYLFPVLNWVFDRITR